MYHKLRAWIIIGKLLEIKTRMRKSCLLESLFKSILEVLTSYPIGLEKGSNKRELVERRRALS